MRPVRERMRGRKEEKRGCAHTTLISSPFSDASKKLSSVYVYDDN